MSHSAWSSNVKFENGQLTIAGTTASELAREFDTPTFILDEDDFKARASAFVNAMQKSFSGATVYYASKAFTCKQIARWCNELGLGMDVATGGELEVALSVNFPASRIEVHGNNKSLSEIDRAVEVGVGCIVIDSIQEIGRVADAAKRHGKTQSVMIRLNPGVEAHTIEAIATAHTDVKFGLSISSGVAWDAVIEISKHSQLDFRGVHAHIGSQIFNMDGHRLTIERMLDFMARYRDEFNRELPEVDFGGGFGIVYTAEDAPLAIEDAVAQIKDAVVNGCAARNLKIPHVAIEPGRSIIGPSMFTLYEVGTTKLVQLENGTRNYISVDGGMSDNIRPGLYGAIYEAHLANRTSSAPNTPSRLVGKHCETGDILIRDIDLPSDIAPGDLIAIPATGAYNRSMASNYNHVPRPPVISVRQGSAKVIVRRETFEDLLHLDA
ncbi:MAG: diaminopimelate decarboxylase [Candidatus Nanopelagicaceae bacterium]|nr:diaminopimelate decarboxylase [Candidatus Nanopelagicaceae bacterium]